MFSTFAFYPEHNVDLNNHERMTVMPANVLSTVIMQSVERSGLRNADISLKKEHPVLQFDLLRNIKTVSDYYSNWL